MKTKPLLFVIHYSFFINLIMSIETLNLTNHFLIAMPNLADSNFFHTVTYICMHNEEGAMGIIINRPMKVSLGDILEHLNIDLEEPRVSRVPIYDGGPVAKERGFIIHQPVGDWEAMLTMSDDLGITTSRDVLIAIAQGRGPQRFLVALGYAGWAAGQLEQEIAENAWLTAPVDTNIIFNTPPAKRWQAAAASLGIDVNLMTGEAGHA